MNIHELEELLGDAGCIGRVWHDDDGVYRIEVEVGAPSSTSWASVAGCGDRVGHGRHPGHAPALVQEPYRRQVRRMCQARSKRRTTDGASLFGQEATLGVGPPDPLGAELFA